MNAITDTKPSHLNVYAALAAAQSEMEPVTKDAKNAAFKKPDGSVSRYADLVAVVDAVRPALTKHGLAYFHQMVIFDEKPAMRTVIYHGASDTHIACDVPLIVAANNMQGMKSATTYAKRIGLESVTGVAPEDDDGNAAAKAPPKEEPRQNHASEALRDAWRDGVEDSLPENATPRQKAEAYAAAIIADFTSVKTAKTLAGRWDRHLKIIGAMQERNPDLHEQIVDAYENHMMAIAPQEAN
jgi:ERF superfamily